MSLFEGVTAFIHELNNLGIQYGVIGGIAVFAYGGERTTFDVDFLIDGKHRDELKNLAKRMKLDIVNENAEVIQFSGAVQIDIIFANRPAAKAMLGRLRHLEDLPFPVVAPEDLIGLKIQAFVGDRKREFIDKGDIITIMRNIKDLDYKKVEEYANIFNVWDEICDLKKRI